MTHASDGRAAAEGRARWQARYDAARKRDADFTTLSGLEVDPVYGPADGAEPPGFDRIGWPGEYHGKIPRRYAASKRDGDRSPPAASRPEGSSSARSVGGNHSGGSLGESHVMFFIRARETADADESHRHSDSRHGPPGSDIPRSLRGTAHPL